jgi:hypothetical protein
MKTNFLVSTVLLATLALPLTAQAQGTVRGAEEGARDGGRAAGPAGAVVGGAVGAAAGTVGGILGVEERPRFREYVQKEHRRSYKYDRDVVVGAELPSTGITYYEVPAEYGVKEYRYTVVNDRPVLVDPRSHKIVEVIE